MTVLLSTVSILILHTFISLFGEGNGSPLQYSCLENPMDKGAQRTTAHRVAELDMTEVTSHAHASVLNNKYEAYYLLVFSP